MRGILEVWGEEDHRGNAVTMTCHVLHAGDGYTYLTRQVASGDTTRPAGDPLVDYYQVAGNPSGRWVGSGCADLEVSGEVSEDQMLALFGEGLHPNANAIVAERMARGDSYDQALAAARLGRKFYQFDAAVPLVADLRTAYVKFAKRHGRRATVAERRGIKRHVAAEHLAAASHGTTRFQQTSQHHAVLDATPDLTSSANPADVDQYLVDQLGKARQPVAGFDLVFSPPKSVSVLWALGGPEVRHIVEAVHERAWRGALAYGEREAAFTRLGASGIAFAPTSGFVATAFQHRDSRAGDPDLHTHVAVANRVLAEDGKWRTLDSRQMHKVAVSMSETYNSLTELGLIDELGVRYTEVLAGAGKRPVREIDGIPREWTIGFSRRRTQVETHYDRLVAGYVRDHGHSPPRSVQHKLAQQAALTDRPEKIGLRTLAAQVADWTSRAQELLPGMDIRARIHSCLHRTVPGAGPDLAEVAARVVERIADDRATWVVYHVRAEAHRQLRPNAAFFTGQHAEMDGDERLLGAVETVTALALDRHSLRLGAVAGEPREKLPRALRMPDGESVFVRRGSAVYTSENILAAEQRLVDDAHTVRGPVVPDAVRNVALSAWQHADPDRVRRLDAGQRALVEHFVSCGKALAVGIGPPGAGKSTVMAAVRAAWETTGGRVHGYAPSAAAASVLGDDLGVRADTLHSLLEARRHGATIDVRAGDMLLVDEAGMAGTRLLDEVRALAAERGAVVRLVGDYRQLSAVEAGGVLRLIHHDAGGVELSELHRFTHRAEAQAILRFRVGDDRAIDFYADNDRLVGGVGPAVLDRLYADWKADIDAGATAIMIGDTGEVARELSSRAQTERRATGLVENDGVRLHDGSIAGVGDRIVTRLNRRDLALFGGRDYVKNGDLWEVEARHDDGRLRVRHVRHGGTVLLSAQYVARFVELGYAATIHRSQGLTVDVSRAFLSTAAAREAALVALSRGREANYAYLDTQEIVHPDEPPVLPGDLFYRYRERSRTEEALRAILRRESAELSATEQLRNAMEEPHRLSTLVPQYLYARHIYRDPGGQQAEQWVREALPDHADDIVTDNAWPELARVLHEVNDAHHDPIDVLRRRAAQRPLDDDPIDPADSVAEVLHWRITKHMPTPPSDRDRPDWLPGWVPTPPHPDEDITTPGNLADIAELGTWLRTHVEQIADRTRELGERVAQKPPAWAADLGPVPDEPITRDLWIRRAGHVTAYRERWQIPDTVTDLLPSHDRGEQGRARAWVATYLRAHPLDRATELHRARQTRERDRWCQHNARVTDRISTQRRDHEDAQRRRDTIAALLRATWRHEPTLVEAIIASRAFDTVARRLHGASQAGYDLHGVLAELPLDAIDAPHIEDPAAYTAAMVDVAVERIRTGEADRDADQRAEQRRFAQMHDQAADLLREAWATRPQLAETVIHSPAFDALVRALDRHTDTGLNAHDLLAAIPLAKLDAPHIRHKDRYAVYLTDQVAERQLDALEHTRRAASERAERHEQRQAAAQILRHAWATHPDLADRVVTGPAFRFLAERMAAAEQSGHNVHGIICGLDPVALTAPHVRNPSGVTTYAFARALEQHALDTRPAPPVAAAASAPAAVPEQRATATTHWTRRPHGALTDATLRARITAAQHTADQIGLARDNAQHKARQASAAASAGHGPNVRALDNTLAHLRTQTALIRETDQLEQRWHALLERAADAAEQRAHAEHDLDRLGRLARTRRAELAERIEQLRGVEHDATREADTLADQAAQLRQQAGPREQREQLTAQAIRTEAEYPLARETAYARDLAAANTAERHAADLTAQHNNHMRELDQLRSEHELRDQLPTDDRQREDLERGLAQATAADADRQPPTPDPHITAPSSPGLAVPVLTPNELNNSAATEPQLATPDAFISTNTEEPGIEQTVPPPDPDDLER
ncbi:MobF family relaxase [Actinophytocola glycyrrhizae]|uniref:MobF family relaxase n=1 Tax=Actinophytocola glycyrrhizae TaxID=2044873 RepID=A0ABV9SFP5_9PSEU